MKRILLAFMTAFVSHLLLAQVTPVQPKTTTATVRTIPADQALLMRTDTKTIQSELEKLRDSLALIQRDLTVQIEALKSKSGNNLAMQAAEASALREMLDSMAAMQAKFETATKMMIRLEEMRKSILMAWPTKF